MKLKKKISAVLALCLALSVFAGCSDTTEEPNEEVMPNVITSGTQDPSADGGDDNGTTVFTGETAVVTDESGNEVTGVNGDVLTERVTEPGQTEATLSPEQLEEIINNTTTQNTQPLVTSEVKSSDRYGYNTLDDNEKALYDAILNAASTMTSKIRVTDSVTLETWAKVFGMVYNQEPQLFWLNSKIKVGRIYFNEVDTAKITEMQAEIDTTVDKILADANKESTTFGKLKVFHDYLVYNSSFELKDGVADYNETIYNAFGHSSSEQGIVQCGGYAKAIQYLCDKSGIECMVITGNRSDGSSHAWNKIKIDGEWYNLDTTWDDPIFSPPVYDYIRYNFFLVPDEWINEKTHINVNKLTLNSGAVINYFTPPTADSTAENYFVKNGLLFDDKDSADAALKKALDDAANSGAHVASIMAGSQEVYDYITSNLITYKKYVMNGHSNVTNLTNNCNEEMLLIQLDLKY